MLLDTQPVITQARISTPNQGPDIAPITEEELARYLKKWRAVSDVARAFAGWYNINDVRRFVSYLDRQYRQTELTALQRAAKVRSLAAEMQQIASFLPKR